MDLIIQGLQLFQAEISKRAEGLGNTVITAEEDAISLPSENLKNNLVLPLNIIYPFRIPVH